MIIPPRLCRILVFKCLHMHRAIRLIVRFSSGCYTCNNAMVLIGVEHDVREYDLNSIEVLKDKRGLSNFWVFKLLHL
ncbi:MAG: hypothetical protein AYK19_20880 [Theionarchaea archaeon DG-70-1]|nr:MAG: hypothetical protein AYK19_20880 [Theionarchaea archaeon DG-70-1]